MKDIKKVWQYCMTILIIFFVKLARVALPGNPKINNKSFLLQIQGLGNILVGFNKQRT